jgi:hypothetical protein
MSCVACLAGKAGQHGQHGATASDHCEVCAAGQYQDEHAQAACHACPKVDDVRYQWSPAGQTHCTAVPVDCKPSEWSGWGVCSRSCTPLSGALKDAPATSGIQTRTRTPSAQLPCALQDQSMCSQPWGGGKQCSEFHFSENRACNKHLCPVNCEVGGWGEWAPCTKRCQGGSSTRVRTVTIRNANGGEGCPALAQTSACNDGVSCDEWDLPTCQADHVHCEVRQHSLHAPRAWWMAIKPNGHKYYHNRITGANQDAIPEGLHPCGGALPKMVWNTTAHKAKLINPLDKHAASKQQWHQERVGSFVVKADQMCVNNQNCGLIDIGRCHDCDTEQECKDLGISSTVFVTHHRKHMALQHFDRSSGTYRNVNYHCRKHGVSGCQCKCDSHPPCTAKVHMMLQNTMLHANVYPNTPTLQDCCNMCTNHPNCGSWEYSSLKICVLKSGAPVFTPQPAGSSFVMWSGCPAGHSC